MKRVCHVLCSLLIVVMTAVSTTGVAVAATVVEHQANCLTAISEQASDTTLVHTHDHVHADEHDHANQVAGHSVPGHDHDTCMMHSCPALSSGALELSDATDCLLLTIVWPDKPWHALDLANGLKRPPKT